LKFSPRTWFLFGILYIFYIAYGTLLPFNFSFSFDIIQNNIGNIEWLEHYGRAYFITKNIDAIANIFFFIPLGLLIYNARFASGHKRRYLLDIFLATISGLLLSTVIEFMQLLIVERKTSIIDILMNTIGCFFGAILGYLFNQFLMKVTRQKIGYFVKNLPPIILIMPFLLVSLFISEKFSLKILNSEKTGNIHFNWNFIFKPIWIWLVLYVYIPIGTLVTATIRKKYSKFTLPMIYLISFIVAITISGLVELIKYFGHSTSTPFENILFGIFGILIGMAFSEVFGKGPKPESNSEKRKIVNILTVIYGLLGFIILYKSTYPFKFNFSKSYIFDKTLFSLLSTYSFIPFTGLLKLFIYSAQNILLFLPIGIVIWELETYLNDKKKIVLLVTSLILIIIISFTIQILNQNLTPFLYEIPTNILGIFTGYFIWHGFQSEDP
jgi:glycopeptide antibiotics resistance protein